MLFRSGGDCGSCGGGRWWAMVGDGWVGDFRWLERVFVFLVLFGTGAGCVFGVILV
mgnify:FL=1